MTKNVMHREPRKITSATAIAHQSPVFNGFATYHVRFFFLPKPRKSMALLISSIRSNVENIRGHADVHHILHSRPQLLLLR